MAAKIARDDACSPQSILVGYLNAMSWILIFEKPTLEIGGGLTRKKART